MDHVGAPLSTLPPPAALNMPRLNQFRLLSDLNAASEVCRERAPVVEMKFVPARIYPPAVFVTSPQGARDVLGAGPGVMDKRAPIFVEGRKWMGETCSTFPMMSGYPGEERYNRCSPSRACESLHAT